MHVGRIGWWRQPDGDHLAQGRARIVRGGTRARSPRVRTWNDRRSTRAWHAQTIHDTRARNTRVTPSTPATHVALSSLLPSATATRPSVVAIRGVRCRSSSSSSQWRSLTATGRPPRTVARRNENLRDAAVRVPIRRGRVGRPPAIGPRWVRVVAGSSARTRVNCCSRRDPEPQKLTCLCRVVVVYPHR